MDYIFDAQMKKNLCYIATKQIEANGQLVINVIRFEPLVYSWTIGIQRSYFDQYEIDIGKTKNCGDIMRGSQKLLVIVCSKNGAISIYRRDQLVLHLQKPLVEVPGDETQFSTTGNSIGFIESIEDEKLSQTFVFLTVSYSKESQKQPKILSWEILINDQEKGDSVGLNPQEDALVIELQNMEE
jgi:hypothetical protein